jgi:hypothetical protein
MGGLMFMLLKKLLGMIHAETDKFMGRKYWILKLNLLKS